MRSTSEPEIIAEDRIAKALGMALNTSKRGRVEGLGFLRFFERSCERLITKVL